MDLTFVQTSNMFGRDGAWETEFSVDQEFNLHLERESSGKIIMMQKTAGTFFDIVKDFDMKSGDVVYDYDSASFLGTKTIKIVSESAIRFASLTTSGEVTEIKSQSKEIEVTSNGTMDITPDAGFAYLSAVKVKTNVQSGEGGGSASGGNTYEYIDVRRPSDWQGENFTGSLLTPLIFSCCLLAKVNIESTQVVATAGQILSGGTSLITNVTAISVDISMEVFNGTGYSKVGDLMKEIGADSLPRITKEQFYNLNA